MDEIENAYADFKGDLSSILYENTDKNKTFGERDAEVKKLLGEALKKVSSLIAKDIS